MSAPLSPADAATLEDMYRDERINNARKEIEEYGVAHTPEWKKRLSRLPLSTEKGLQS